MKAYRAPQYIYRERQSCSGNSGPGLCCLRCVYVEATALKWLDMPSQVQNYVNLRADVLFEHHTACCVLVSTVVETVSVPHSHSSSLSSDLCPLLAKTQFSEWDHPVLSSLSWWSQKHLIKTEPPSAWAPESLNEQSFQSTGIGHIMWLRNKLLLF